MQPLIRNIMKTTSPVPPGQVGPDGLTTVPGLASVPVRVSLQSLSEEAAVGVDLVFVIDNSGSMTTSDPNMERFNALRNMAELYEVDRNDLDRIAIIIFKGTSASLVQDWSTWTQTKAAVPALQQISVDGATPMESAMRLANQRLATAPASYRMAILLSDGDPVPDDQNHPQVSNITNELLPAAHANRILYSTIYLAPAQGPYDNALLIDIARATDYITSDSQSEVSPFYRRVDDLNSLLDDYRILFSELSDRVVPLDVRVVEQVSNRLTIDPLAPVTFSGDGFDESVNLIANATIEESCDTFRQTNRFETHFNELDGTAELRFSVKLDIDSITDLEMAAGFADIQIDDLPDSSVTYLRPAGTSPIPMTQPLGQAIVRFMFGLQTVKNLDSSGNTVEISLKNMDLAPIEWVELVEYPSVFVDTSNHEDDFSFHPFESLIQNVFGPWYYRRALGAIRTPFPRLSGTSPPGDRVVPDEVILPIITAALTKANKGLLKRASGFNRRLRCFHFGNAPIGLDDFWRTSTQVGTYHLETELPGQAERSITFGVHSASYVSEGSTAQAFKSPVDAVTPKEGASIADRTLSHIRCSRWRSEQTVLPNEDYYHLALPAAHPDLVVLTCFSSEDVHRLRALFTNPHARSTWSLLDSSGISLQFDQVDPLDSLAIRVRVWNVGGLTADSNVNVSCYVLPFVPAEWTIPNQDDPDLDQYALSLAPSGAYFAEGSATGVVSPHSYRDVQIELGSYRTLRSTGRAGARVNVDQLQRVRDAIVISTVDVEAADSELLLANNQAIEIARLRA